MKRSRLLLFLQFTVWVLAGSLAACTTTDSTRPNGVPVEFAGEEGVRPAELRRFARRELAAFRSGLRGPADLADAAYAMERGLAEQGHAHAVVTFAMLPSEDAVEHVVFTVKAGPVVALGDVDFSGVTVFTPEQLANIVTFRGSGWLGRGNPIYRRSGVEDALDDLERRYLDEGYFRVVVGPPVVTWAEERRRADIRVPVQEGPRHVVASVAVEGALDDPLRRELEALVADVGGAYRGRTPSTLASRVRGILLDRGHQLARVEATADVDATDGGVAIRITVAPGPVVALRAVRINGLERTDEGFVRGKVEFEPGAPITRTAVDDAVDSLYRAGIFRSVRRSVELVDPVPDAGVPGDPVPADLILDLTELDARTIDVELGWGSYELLRGRARYRDRNLFGGGRLLDLTAKASVRSFEVDGRLSDRHLLGPTWTLSSGLGYEWRQEPSFARRSLRYDVTLRKDFDHGVHAETGYLLRAQDATSVNGEIRRAEEDGLVRAAGLFGRSTWDTRDDPLFPTAGFLAQSGVFWSDASLGGELDFLETGLAASAYHSFGEGTVLAVTARVRTRDILDDRSSLPIQERLFLGGENTVRSFGESELGPVDAAGDPRGGLTAANASIELRQRLFDDLAGALFYDVGTVSPRSWTFSDDYGSAIGIGLRYHLPVGPARLDFAYNPGDRFAAKDGWALHFSFGFAF